MSPSSVSDYSGDEITDDELGNVDDPVSSTLFLWLSKHKLLTPIQDGLIIDLDIIQAHGKSSCSSCSIPSNIRFIGVGASDITKLRQNGYFTVAVRDSHLASSVRRADLVCSQSVHAATKKTLIKIKGLSEAKVEKIKEAIGKALVCGFCNHEITTMKIIEIPQPNAGFMTAMELGHQRKKVVKISTGSKQWDSILNG